MKKTDKRKRSIDDINGIAISVLLYLLFSGILSGQQIYLKGDVKFFISNGTSISYSIKKNIPNIIDSVNVYINKGTKVQGFEPTHKIIINYFEDPSKKQNNLAISHRDKIEKKQKDNFSHSEKKQEYILYKENKNNQIFSLLFIGKNYTLLCSSQNENKLSEVLDSIYYISKFSYYNGKKIKITYQDSAFYIVCLSEYGIRPPPLFSI